MAIFTQRGACLALICALAAGGCGTADKVYQSNGEKNLRITAKTLGDSFATVNAMYLYVYEIDRQCKLDYLGHVAVDKPALEVGLPTGKPLVLTAQFASGGRFDRSGLRNSYSYLIELRPGYHYAADIQHQPQFHKFALSEGRRGGPMRGVERKGPESCVPK
jgi:hypothetical protein